MDQLNKAIEFAALAHTGQNRKQCDIPYISHPFAVAMLLKQHGASEQVIIAALLHDVPEDTPYSIDDIRERFGDGIADIVSQCIEHDRTLKWEQRKRSFIEQAKNASSVARQVIYADKIHNLWTIQRDFQQLGMQVWDRFTRGYPQQKWYYQTFIQKLEPVEATDPPNQLWIDLKKRVTDLFGVISEHNSL
jgi:(p)ppGpp synthase/HD superfamily hydrolase